MMDTDSKSRTMKRRLSAEPLVHHHSESILITGWQWVAMNLLRCHIPGRPSHLSPAVPLARCRGNRGRNAKVGEPYLIMWSQQQILRFDIAVDHMMVVEILQRTSSLQDSRQDAGEGQKNLL